MLSKIRNIKKVLLSDNWYTLHKVIFDYRLNDGTWVTQARECYDRGNGAAVLLYNTEKQSVILIRQFRMPTFLNGNASGMVIEVCAGLLDGDDPASCVIKEVEEEAGYRVQKVEKVYEAYMSPGAVTEILHFFVVEYTDDMKVSDGGGLESEQEEIEVLEVPFKQALEMIRTGEIRDAKTIMLLQYLQIHKGPELLKSTGEKRL